MSSTTPSRRALFTGAGVATVGAVGAVVASGSAAQAAPVSLNLLDNPVRAYDSRVIDGKLAARTTRTVSLVGLPANTVGISATINATKGERRGFAIVFPGGAPKPSTSTVKYEKNVPTQGSVIIKLGPANTLSIYTAQNVHIVVDVTAILA